MSCCGSLFVNLGGGGGGTVNTGVLQTPTALSATLQVVEDQNGTDSVLSLSNKFAKINADSLGFGNGGVIIGGLNGNLGGIWGASLIPDASNYSFLAGTTTYLNCTSEIALEKTGTRFATFNQNAFDFGGSPITNNGVLTVKGNGGNIASFRDSTNVEKASIDNSGQVSATNIIASNAGIFDGSSLYRAIDTGSINIYNGGSATAGIEIYGSTNATTFLRNKILAKTSFIGLGEINSATAPAIKRNTENIDFRLSNDNGYCGITAGRSTEKTLEVLEVSGAMGLGFFNTPAINQPVTGGASATYASVSGTEIKENDTFDGYTVGGVVKALRNLGLLA
jgi:hypothetical protein